MKIGIDARMYGIHFTGIGRYSYELIQHLAEPDQTNEYFVFLRKEAFREFEPPNSRFHKVLAEYQHYSFGEQIGFLRLLNSYQLDLMHFTHFNAPIFYRRPFIVTIHDLTLTFYPGKKMNTWLHRMAYHWTIRSVTKHARRIIAVSNHTKQDLIKVLGVPEDKIEMIYHGVSPQFSGSAATLRPELMQKLGLARPFFLYTGVWREHKNVVGMIKAFADFNREHGQQYDLVITGKTNPTYHEIPDTVRQLNLRPHVHLVGIVSEPDLQALYQNAIAYVFPSFYEGFGFPPLEAMQAGTPVLASSLSAVPEVCGEGNALYFDPHSIDDMKAKMRQIASDASLRQKLTDRGRERVKLFKWEETVKKTLNLYGATH